jgi:hypothetical protein
MGRAALRAHPEESGVDVGHGPPPGEPVLPRLRCCLIGQVQDRGDGRRRDPGCLAGREQVVFEKNSSNLSSWRKPLGPACVSIRSNVELQRTERFYRCQFGMAIS